MVEANGYRSLLHLLGCCLHQLLSALQAWNRERTGLLYTPGDHLTVLTAYCRALQVRGRGGGGGGKGGGRGGEGSILAIYYSRITVLDSLKDTPEIYVDTSICIKDTVCYVPNKNAL